MSNNRSKYTERKDKSVVVLAAYRNLAPGNKDAVYCSKKYGFKLGWEIICFDKTYKDEPCLSFFSLDYNTHNYKINNFVGGKSFKQNKKYQE